MALAAPQQLDGIPTVLVYPPFWHTPLGIHRGTPELLRTFVGDRTHFASPEGLACTRLLCDSDQPPAQDDCRVTVIGANAGLGHLLYNPSMTRLEVLGDRGPTAGLFRRPTGVALYPDGTAYVTDPVGQRVIRLHWQGGDLTPEGELAAPPGGWKEPWGVAFAADKFLYVSDAGRQQILVFSPEGKLQRMIGPALTAQVHLTEPRAVSVADVKETWSFYHDDYLYICDQAGSRILRINPKADPIQIQVWATVSVLPAAAAAGSFTWMDLDYYENLWVTDAVACRIHKFDRHLNYLASYGQAGTGDSCFQRPTGIAIYRHFGQVFVAEAQGAHYFWIGTDVLSPQVRWQDAKQLIVQIQFNLPEPSSLTLSAQPQTGGPVAVVAQSPFLDSGQHSLLWKLPPKFAANPVIFTFVAEATYSSAQHFAKRCQVTFTPQQ